MEEGPVVASAPEGPMTRSRARKVNSLSSLEDSTVTDGDLGEAMAYSNIENDLNNVSNGNIDNLEMVVSPASDDDGSDELGTKTAIGLLMLIFTSSVLVMGLVWTSFPDVNIEDQKSLKFPKDLEDAKQLGIVLSRYKDQYFAQVFSGFVCVYIFLQTFAIPGSIFLSIISGFLFPFPLALFAVCFCSATGASFCYLLSFLVGRRLVRHYLPERSAQWSQKVDSHRSNLLSYILFLRITPFLPNWFINIVSPVIGVPLFPFWTGTFFGVAPPSFIFIQAGTTLQQMTSTMDPINAQTVLLLVVFALLSILPALLKNKLKAKFD